MILIFLKSITAIFIGQIVLSGALETSSWRAFDSTQCGSGDLDHL